MTFYRVLLSFACSNLLQLITMCSPHYPNAYISRQNIYGDYGEINITYTTNYNRLQINFIIKPNNRPESAKYYKIVSKKKKGQDISLKEGAIENKFTTLNFTVDKFIYNSNNEYTLHIETTEIDQKTIICQNKLPFRLILYKSKGPSAVPQHICLTDKGCNYDIKMNCETPGKHKEDILIVTNLPMPESTSTLTEGTEASYTCKYGGANRIFFLKWTYTKKNKDEGDFLSYFIGNSGADLTVKFDVHTFDNNTQWSCMAFPASGRVVVLAEKKFTVYVKPSDAVQKYDSTMLNANITQGSLTYYQDGQSLSFTCNGGPSYILHTWMKLKENNELERYNGRNNELHTNRTIQYTDMTMDQNDTRLFCLAYESKISYLTHHTHHSMERRISNIIHLIMATDTQDIESGMPTAGSDMTPVIAGLVCGGVLLVALTVSILCYRSRKSVRSADHEVETYACPRVQYIDLQMSEGSGRTISHNDTPYAQIIGYLEPDNK